MSQQKIRIRLRSYDHRLIDRTAKRIIKAVDLTTASVAGPIPLPTKHQTYNVLRGPTIHKEEQERFGRNTYTRLIEIKAPNPKTIDALMKLAVPAGVDAEIKSY